MPRDCDGAKFEVVRGKHRVEGWRPGARAGRTLQELLRSALRLGR